MKWRWPWSRVARRLWAAEAVLDRIDGLVEDLQRAAVDVQDKAAEVRQGRTDDHR